MQVSDIQSRTKRLVELMEKHLGTRGPTLERALRRAGRRLPRGLRDKGQLLVEAERMAERYRVMGALLPGSHIAEAAERLVLSP